MLRQDTTACRSTSAVRRPVVGEAVPVVSTALIPVSHGPFQWSRRLQVARRAVTGDLRARHGLTGHGRAGRGAGPKGRRRRPRGATLTGRRSCSTVGRLRLRNNDGALVVRAALVSRFAGADRHGVCAAAAAAVADNVGAAAIAIANVIIIIILRGVPIPAKAIDQSPGVPRRLDNPACGPSCTFRPEGARCGPSMTLRTAARC